MKLLGHDFQKLEHEQRRQTHRHDRTHYYAAFAGGTMSCATNTDYSENIRWLQLYHSNAFLCYVNSTVNRTLKTAAKINSSVGYLNTDAIIQSIAIDDGTRSGIKYRFQNLNPT